MTANMSIATVLVHAPQQSHHDDDSPGQRPSAPLVIEEAQSPCSSCLFLRTIPHAALTACRDLHMLCADDWAKRCSRCLPVAVQRC